MIKPASCFTAFNQPIDGYALPERFTFPFYYQPHVLCILAAEELQQRLQTPQSWQHNFGLGDDPHLIIGKMFGVLVVQNSDGEIGYLAAFSGKLAEQNHIAGFVPPVFDLLAENSFFLNEQAVIKQLNDTILSLEQNPQLLVLHQQLNSEIAQRDGQIAEYRALMIEHRKARKVQRIAAQRQLDEQQQTLLQAQLDQQSIEDKLHLKALTLHWQSKVEKAQSAFDLVNEKIIVLKNQRKNLSAALQQKIFSVYG